MVVRVELKDIKGGLLEQEYDCSPADFPELRTLEHDAGPIFHAPIHFVLRFQRSGQLVEVDGRLSASVTMTCGRCLKAFTQELEEPFALTFTPLKQSESVSEEVELEAQELGLIPYQDETLELLDPLQEQLIMALPISPICDEACGGLCPVCGQDMNQDPCQCVRKPFNNKFAALADMKFKK